VRRQSVHVLLGGPSAEHDVSLVSGRAIAAALAERGHVVHGWLVGLDRLWWRLPEAALDRAIPPQAFDDPRALEADGPYEAGAALDRLRADGGSAGQRPVVFIALHGPYGEDGTVQALCTAADLVFTGSDVAASALGMDKSLFKRLAGALGMPILPWTAVPAARYAASRSAELERLAAFAATLADRRLVVKPARLGSSVGISVVHRPAEPETLGRAVDEAMTYDDLVLAEAYIAGAREFEVSVVGNTDADLQVFGPGEIFPGHEFYDYEAKYQPGVSRTTDRPELAAPIRDRIRQLAREAYLAIGASGFARVDFLLGGGELYLSEINTIPGFTPISLFPVLCAEGGYDFADISEHIVELAIRRAAHQPQRSLSRADLP
jgi:D-alanine-D-alanine ligase